MHNVSWFCLVWVLCFSDYFRSLKSNFMKTSETYWPNLA